MIQLRGFVEVNMKVREEYWSEDCVNFFTDENKSKPYPGYSEEGTYELSLNDWAVFVNSPWGQSCEKYEISVNCENDYTVIKEGVPTWKCLYYVIGYDGLRAGVYGYGNSPKKALKSCQWLFKQLQKNYNPEDESC